MLACHWHRFIFHFCLEEPKINFWRRFFIVSIIFSSFQLFFLAKVLRLGDIRPGKEEKEPKKWKPNLKHLVEIAGNWMTTWFRFQREHRETRPSLKIWSQVWLLRNHATAVSCLRRQNKLSSYLLYLLLFGWNHRASSVDRLVYESFIALFVNRQYLKVLAKSRAALPEKLEKIGLRHHQTIYIQLLFL